MEKSLHHRLQMLLYPHLLYPGQWICLTGTEFMVVAIAFERYLFVLGNLLLE